MLYKNIFRFVNNNRLLSLFVALSIILIFPLMFSYFKPFLVLTAFLILNIFASILLRPFKRFPHGVELVLFTTVIVSSAYGFKVGALFGIVSIFLSYLVMNRISYYIILLAPCYMIVALIAAFSPGKDIVTLGIICTVIYDILSSILVCITFAGRYHKALFFVLTNFLFNIFLFTTFGELVVRLIG